MLERKLVGKSQRTQQTQTAKLQGAFCMGKTPKAISDALMMEAVQTSETLVNWYQSTRHYHSEDSHLHTHSRENLMLSSSSDLTNLSKAFAGFVSAIVENYKMQVWTSL
jgi:hypothetical protein